METTSMIEVRNLVKYFGRHRAVNDLSFSVERGEVLGFLGPNGAGKSTTMRIITGFYPPTSGSVTVGGFDVVDQAIAARRLIGYLPENAPGYADMTVTAFLGFAADLRGLRGDAKKRAIGSVVETCFLGEVLHQTIETLSKGYKHRTCLAQSIIHDPDVLILDEPTDGLDPNQKHEVRGLIKRLGETKAIIFSTHILEEVEAVCSRVIIIDRGTIVANGTPRELKARSPFAGAVRFSIAHDGDRASLQTALAALPAQIDMLSPEDQPGRTTIRATPQAGGDGLLAAHIIDLARARQWQLEDIVVEEGRLDEVFREITLPDTVRKVA